MIDQELAALLLRWINIARILLILFAVLLVVFMVVFLVTNFIEEPVITTIAVVIFVAWEYRKYARSLQS